MEQPPTTFILTGNTSVLSRNYNPAIYLDGEYEIGLTNFDTFNFIPNIDKSNNLFVWGGEAGEEEKSFEISTGSYELNDLVTIIQNQVGELDESAQITFTVDVHTAKVSITSNRRINFMPNNSVGRVFGFFPRILEPTPSSSSSSSSKNSDGQTTTMTTHLPDEQVRILRINTVCIDCNIAVGSFLNSEPVHIIHQFFPSVPYGYKIIESPLNILYYPVSIKTINNITCKIIDQKGNLISFGEDEITIRLHLRRKN